jgi:hypothetical protein
MPGKSSNIKVDHGRRLRSRLADYVGKMKQLAIQEHHTAEWTGLVNAVLDMVADPIASAPFKHLLPLEDIPIDISMVGVSKYSSKSGGFNTIASVGYTAPQRPRPLLELERVAFPGAAFDRVGITGYRHRLSLLPADGSRLQVMDASEWEKYPSDVVNQYIKRPAGSLPPLASNPAISHYFGGFARGIPRYWEAAEAMMDLVRSVYAVYEKRFQWSFSEDVLMQVLRSGPAAIRWSEVSYYFPEMRGILTAYADHDLLSELDAWRDRGNVRPLGLFLGPGISEEMFKYHRGRLAATLAQKLLQA